MQRARQEMRTCYQGTDTVQRYVERFRKVAVPLLSCTQGELVDNFIVGLCPEVRIHLQLKKLNTLQDATTCAMRWQHVRGKEKKGHPIFTVEEGIGMQHDWEYGNGREVPENLPTPASQGPSHSTVHAARDVPEEESAPPFTGKA